jgi:hypothetical protein
MTPLAHLIVKDSLQPKASRRFTDQCGLLGRLDDIHCFDVSDVREAACDLAIEMHRKVIPERIAFLPAPRTWIEWREDEARIGALIEIAKNDESVAFVRFALAQPGKFGSVDGGLLHLFSSPRKFGATSHPAGAEDRAITLRLYGYLALINTPRFVGRVTHIPHAGLQKRIAAARGMTGKFPLKAWTEIKLSITPPEYSGGHSDGRLTGERALHFCRAHLRIRLGQLEMVKAHWRGDASMGIKQSRYKLSA